MKKDLFLLKKLFSKPFRLQKAGGQTNRNYIVTLKNKKFFVRLPWEGVLDRRIEGKNILVLSRNKKLKSTLPKYYVYVLNKKNILVPKDKKVFNVPDGTMVTEYVKGRELTLRMFSLKKYQKALVHLLYTLHTSRVRFCNPYDVFRDEVRKYRKRAERLSLETFFSKQTIAQLKTLEYKAQQLLRSFRRGVPAHNDFLLQNILVANNGRLYLLDFEYAGMNKKGGIFYDLGYMFRDTSFKPPQMSRKAFERFLMEADKVYKKKLDRQQIYWSIVAALLVGIWWGVLRYFSVPRKERAYFRAYVRRGVRGVLRLRPFMGVE